MAGCWQQSDPQPRWDCLRACSPEEVAAIRAECNPKFDQRFATRPNLIANPLARTVIGGHDNWENGEEAALGTKLMAATV